MTSLRLDAAATIADAAELRSHLLGAMEGADPIQIDASALLTTDITILQVLIAAQRAADARSLAFRLDASPALVAAFERAGLPVPVPLDAP